MSSKAAAVTLMMQLFFKDRHGLCFITNYECDGDTEVTSPTMRQCLRGNRQSFVPVSDIMQVMQLLVFSFTLQMKRSSLTLICTDIKYYSALLYYNIIGNHQMKRRRFSCSAVKKDLNNTEVTAASVCCTDVA